MNRNNSNKNNSNRNNLSKNNRSNKNSSRNNLNSFNNVLVNDYNYVSSDTIIIVISFMIIIIILIYAYKQYKIYQETIKELNIEKKRTAECPDYWETTAEDTCVNTHKIGKCGLTAPYSFKGEIFKNQKTGDYSKCIWAKDCEVPWHNISNLC